MGFAICSMLREFVLKPIQPRQREQQLEIMKSDPGHQRKCEKFLALFRGEI